VPWAETGTVNWDLIPGEFWLTTLIKGEMILVMIIPAKGIAAALRTFRSTPLKIFLNMVYSFSYFLNFHIF